MPGRKIASVPGRGRLGVYHGSRWISRNRHLASPHSSRVTALGDRLARSNLWRIAENPSDTYLRVSEHLRRKVFPACTPCSRNAGNGRGVFTAALTVAVFRASENKFLCSYNRTVKWQRFIRNDYAPGIHGSARAYVRVRCVVSRERASEPRFSPGVILLRLWFTLGLGRDDRESIVQSNFRRASNEHYRKMFDSDRQTIDRKIAGSSDRWLGFLSVILVGNSCLSLLCN